VRGGENKGLRELASVGFKVWISDCERRRGGDGEVGGKND